MSLAPAGFKGLTIHPGKDIYSSAKWSQCGSDPNLKRGRKQRLGVQNGGPFSHWFSHLVQMSPAVSPGLSICYQSDSSE